MAACTSRGRLGVQAQWGRGGPSPQGPCLMAYKTRCPQPGLAACVSASNSLKPEARYLACLRICLQPHPRGCNRQLWALLVPQTSQHGAPKCPRTLGHQPGQDPVHADPREVHAPPPAAATCTALLRLLPDPGRCTSGRAALPRLPPRDSTSLACRRTSALHTPSYCRLCG